jgi:hypothetical protein
VAATHEPVNPIARYFLSLTKPPQLPSEPKEFSNADLRGARFTDTDLSGSSFQEVSFQYARLRGVDFVHAEIWGAIAGLVINGVEIEPLIEAELERRFPGRATLFAADADGVRAAWQTIETLWSATVERARALPEPARRERVHGEWSFLETLRHLVMVDDGFLRQVLAQDRPIYKQGVPHTPQRPMFRSVIDLDADPSMDEVLAVREARMAEIRTLLNGIDDVELRRVCRKIPLDPSGMDMPVLYCFWRLVNEEWEHHSFAVRDLETIETRA